MALRSRRSRPRPPLEAKGHLGRAQNACRSLGSSKQSSPAAAAVRRLRTRTSTCRATEHTPRIADGWCVMMMTEDRSNRPTYRKMTASKSSGGKRGYPVLECVCVGDWGTSQLLAQKPLYSPAVL
eukprot:2639372-Prymnesium_polylepis.1